MELQDFKDLTGRLERFHDKALNDEQYDVWWETLKDKDFTDYKEAVRKGMTEVKYMPKLAEIIDWCEQSREERSKIPESEYKSQDCMICRGKGYVVFYRNIGEQWYQTMCRCSCKNGDYVYPKGMANFGKLHLQHDKKTGKWFDPSHYSYADIYGKKENT